MVEFPIFSECGRGGSSGCGQTVNIIEGGRGFSPATKRSQRGSQVTSDGSKTASSHARRGAERWLRHADRQRPLPAVQPACLQQQR